MTKVQMFFCFNSSMKPFFFFNLTVYVFEKFCRFPVLNETEPLKVVGKSLEFLLETVRTFCDIKDKFIGSCSAPALGVLIIRITKKHEYLCLHSHGNSCSLPTLKTKKRKRFSHGDSLTAWEPKIFEL